MLHSDIDQFCKIKEKIEIKYGDDNMLIVGTINISPNEYTTIEIVEKNIPDIIKRIQENETIHFIYNLNIYTAIINSVYDNEIYVETIIDGDHKQTGFIFNEVEIYLTNMNKYFLAGRIDADFVDDTYKRKISMPIFDIEVTDYRNRKLVISNKFKYSQEKNGRSIIIDEYPVIRIKSLTSSLSLEDLKSLVSDMSILFTLLLGRSVSSCSIWGFLIEDQHPYNIYYPTGKTCDETMEWDMYSLINYQLIVKYDYMKTILENFYNKSQYSSFKNIWSKLAALLSGNNAWEYNLLGYMSLLNQYLEKHFRKNKILEDKTKLPEQYKDFVLDQVKEKIRLNLLDNEYEKVEKSINEIEELYSPYRDSSFKSMFIKWYDLLDPNIKNVLKFSEKEFMFLKKFKDNVSHANHIKYEDINYSELTELEHKIQLLLFYIVYKELGIKDIHILKAFSYTLNNIVRLSNIDKKYLDEVLRNNSL